jgi:superfamily II DNA or RNA helicase
MIPAKILTVRGYSVAKDSLRAEEDARMKKELHVTPNVPPTFAGTVSSFKLWIESPSRYYLPFAWASKTFGKADADTRPQGESLSTVAFAGSLRPHQVEALDAFRKAEHNGIICLPCGYGKTFTGIAAAANLGKCFLIVVHKEFLADQWTSELQTLMPGIRIGRIQGEKCDVGPGIDVAIAMIQTLCSRNYPVGTFDRFGFAIFDEVHHLGAEHFSQALQRISCRRMLGLTATPKRADGLSKVFEMYLGSIVYQIDRRPKDDTVIAETLRYTCADPDYAELPVNWKGEIIRAHMINRIAEYGPRTETILDWIRPIMDEEGRRLLILSDRREHLIAFETGFKSRGIDSIGYYVGGMKQKDLDISATKQIILGTFAMASEGMNIPTLNAVLLATPKSNIEQSVGRILRQKKEDRAVQPIILDVLDTAFVECYGQWAKRKKFYVECGYKLRWFGEDEPKEKEQEKEKKGVCIIEDEL